MEHHPEILDNEQLAKLFRYLADMVEVGDSFEGFIEYLIPDEDIIRPQTFAVRARYRTGNLHGQGGMSFIGELK